MPSRPPHLDAPTPELEAWFPPHAIEQWHDAATKILKGKPLASLTRTHVTGLEVAPLHPPMSGYPAHGVPDRPPYTRGAGVLDRRDAGWDVRALHDAGALDDVAEAIGADLARGTRSVWLVPDGAGRGLSGRPAEGLALRAAGDLDRVLEHVDGEAVPIHITPGEAGLGWLHALLAWADRRGVAATRLTGAVPYDPAGVLAQQGVLRAGVKGAFQQLVTALRESHEAAPWLHVVGVRGTVWRSAGAHAAQELGLMLAQGAEYLRAAEVGGISPEVTAAHTLLQVSVGSHTFEEIAKLRALRWTWSKLIAAAGGGAAAQRAFIHAVTARSEQSTRDPWVNMLRGTHGAFVAAVAGADAVTVVPFDRSLGAPQPLGQRLATNTQAVLAHESHLAKVADPAGGSRYVESLTDGLARAAWKVLQEVESHGGIVTALREGHVQRMLATTRRQRQRALSRRKQVLVGVSLFADLGEVAEERAPVQATEASTHDPVTDVRDHVRAGGDIAATVPRSDPWTCTALDRWTASGGWEALRDASDAWQRKHGRRPRVFLATLGAPLEHKPRTEFATRLFEAGGFEVHAHPGATVVDVLVSAVEQESYEGVCVSGRQDDYIKLLPELVKQLSDRGAGFVAVAGKPGVHEDAWVSAGLTHAIYTGCDALGQLREMWQAIGGM